MKGISFVMLVIGALLVSQTSGQGSCRIQGSCRASNRCEVFRSYLTCVLGVSCRQYALQYQSIIGQCPNWVECGCEELSDPCSSNSQPICGQSSPPVTPALPPQSSPSFSTPSQSSNSSGSSQGSRPGGSLTILVAALSCMASYNMALRNRYHK